MNTQTIWKTGALLGVVLLLVGLATLGDSPEEENEAAETNDSSEATSTLLAEELEKLPTERSINGRTVTFDAGTPEPTAHDAYAQLPYEVTIGDRTRLVEARTTFRSGETPVEFIERFLNSEMPPADRLDGYPEDMYEYSVSFHELAAEDLADYPSADRPEAPAAGSGISAHVRGMNFPDDSVGGTEDRFDFIVSANDAWVLVYHGERQFCRRRVNQGYWQAADQPCP